jgi:peptidoglycan/LPS O-acetylase OafA/YrhL
MIKPLTSFRFVFAFFVFLSHLGFLKYSKNNELKWVYNNIFYEGYIGVSFFFILSGFVLAYNYQSEKLSNKEQIYKYYLARLARIFPLHILTFLISIPLTYSIFIENKKIWFFQAFTNFTLTQSFIPLKNIYFSFNGPSWSISCEMFFYLVFPIIIFNLSIFKRFKHVLFFFVIILPFLVFFIPNNWFHALFYINPFFRVIDFIIGILLYKLYYKINSKKLFINFSYLEISSLLIFLLFFIFHSSIIDVARYSFYYWIPISYIIFSFSFQKGFISKILSNIKLIYLGEISFAFYLFHQLVINYFEKLNIKFFHLENEILIIILLISISIYISHLIHKYFELPIKKYLSNRFKKTV